MDDPRWLSKHRRLSERCQLPRVRGCMLLNSREGLSLHTNSTRRRPECMEISTIFEPGSRIAVGL